jgi:hypothetical protein
MSKNIQCQDVAYWRLQLAALGIQKPTGNRYHLRALYVRTKTLALLEQVVGPLLRSGCITKLACAALASTCRTINNATQLHAAQLVKERFTSVQVWQRMCADSYALLSIQSLDEKEKVYMRLNPNKTFKVGRTMHDQRPDIDYRIASTRKFRNVSRDHLHIESDGTKHHVTVLGRNAAFDEHEKKRLAMNVRLAWLPNRPLVIPASDPTHRFELIQVL